MADTVAGDMLVAVGVIFNVCNMMILSVLADFLCREGQHRADGFPVHGRDAAKPSQSGAAGEVEQLGFGGVGGVVGGHEVVVAGQDLREPVVSQLAGHHFDGFPSCTNRMSRSESAPRRWKLQCAIAKCSLASWKSVAATVESAPPLTATR